MIRNKRLELRYALAWLIVGVGIFVLDCFPQLITWMARTLGIASPINMLFFLGFCFSLMIIFVLTVAVSRASIRIKELAQETARRAGSLDIVTAELTRDEFPEKTYGTLTFPAGEYEALRIRIGAGEGHNWWCCLYPGLCFTDAVHVEADKKDMQELRTLLDEDAYEMVTCTSDFRIKWFFFGGHEGDK